MCGSCHRLENCCHAVEAIAAVQAEVAMCLVRFSFDGFMCLVWDTLYVAMAEGRLLKLFLGGFG